MKSLIDKRVLNSFFKLTKTTPKDMMKWLNSIIWWNNKYRKNGYPNGLTHPCIDKRLGEKPHLYANKYYIDSNTVGIGDDFIHNKPVKVVAINWHKNQSDAALGVWGDYRHHNKVLPDLIIEFKIKYSKELE